MNINLDELRANEREALIMIDGAEWNWLPDLTDEQRGPIDYLVLSGLAERRQGDRVSDCPGENGFLDEWRLTEYGASLLAETKT